MKKPALCAVHYAQTGQAPAAKLNLRAVLEAVRENREADRRAGERRWLDADQLNRLAVLEAADKASSGRSGSSSSSSSSSGKAPARARATAARSAAGAAEATASDDDFIADGSEGEEDEFDSDDASAAPQRRRPAAAAATNSRKRARQDDSDSECESTDDDDDEDNRMRLLDEDGDDSMETCYPELDPKRRMQCRECGVWRQLTPSFPMAAFTTFCCTDNIPMMEITPMGCDTLVDASIQPGGDDWAGGTQL